jgi:hypothetical protein
VGRVKPLRVGQIDALGWKTSADRRRIDRHHNQSRPASGTGYAGMNRVGVLKLKSATARPI